jgi:hypothetical protein
MERMRAALRRLGVTAAAHDAPRALAARLRERYGAQGESLAALLDTLERQRYSRASAVRPDAALTRRFLWLAQRLRMQPRVVAPG